MLIGIIGGLVISIKGVKTLWWLMIILFAALINTSIQLVGLYQKRFTLEYFETLNCKEVEEKMEGEQTVETPIEDSEEEEEEEEE